MEAHGPPQRCPFTKRTAQLLRQVPRCSFHKGSYPSTRGAQNSPGHLKHSPEDGCPWALLWAKVIMDCNADAKLSTADDPHAKPQWAFGDPDYPNLPWFSVNSFKARNLPLTATEHEPP